MAAVAYTSNPYVGPRTFEPSERDRFFGRQREARDLTARIVAHRLVLFYAPSGAGKSSLLNTMISPNLAAEGFEVLPRGRVSGFSGDMVPADNIYIYNLLLSLHQTEAIPDAFKTLSLAEFLDNLVLKEDGSYVYWPDYTYPEDVVFRPRVLMIDQFEELVTTNNALWPQRAAFFEQLTEAIARDDQLWVVLSMREDFVTRLDRYLHLTPNFLRDRYQMERLTRAAALQAITQPVRALRPFTDEAANQLADNLMRIRTEEGQEQPRFEQFVEPVQLQAVCYQMWQRLKEAPGSQITVEDVARYADVDAALINFYEDTIDKTVAETGISEIELRAWFDQALVTEAGTRNMVFRGEETTGSLPTAVADFVRQQFILGQVVRPGGTWYELVHDRFVSPIQAANSAWRQEQPLIQLAVAWDEAGRPEERLLSGDQLAQLDETTWPALGPLVNAYVTLSRQARDRQAAQTQKEREAQQQRELAQQQKLAAAEAQRAAEAVQATARQRRLVWIASALAVIAFIAAVVAGLFFQQAQANAADMEQLARSSQILYLAASTFSVLAQESNDELSVLLGIESSRLNDQQNAPYASQVYAGLNNSLTQPFFATQLTDEVNDSAIVTSVVFSPDGTQLASASWDDTIRLWDLTNPAADPTILAGHTAAVSSVAYSPDGTQLASASYDGTIRLWDLTNPAADPTVLVGHTYEVSSVAYSPDGMQLASAGVDATIRLWDLTNPAADPTLLAGHTFGGSSVAYSPDGTQLASCDDATIRLWDLTNPAADPTILAGHTGGVNSVAYSPDGTQLASASEDATIRLWDLTNPADPTSLAGHTDRVLSVAYSPDGTQLASASEDATIRLWDLTNPAADPTILAGHTSGVTSVAYSPDGTRLASAGVDATIRLWDLTNPAGHTDWFSTDWVYSVAYSPDGTQLASAGYDATIRLWDLTNPAADPTILAGHTSVVYSVAYSPDGMQLASASDDVTIRLWDLTNPAADPTILAGHTDSVWSVAYSPDGTQLASAGSDDTIRLWDLTNPAADPTILVGHTYEVSSVAYSPDGMQLASASYDGTIRLWDLTNPAADPTILAGHTAGVWSVAYSPDGTQLASAGRDATIRLWDMTNPAADPTILVGHTTRVTSVAYSPDGTGLASASEDATIRLWDMTNPAADPTILAGHTSVVKSVAYSPDGTQLASAGDDSTIRLWPTTAGLVEIGCVTMRRNLSWEEWQQYLSLEPLYQLTCPNLPAHPSVALALAAMDTASREAQIAHIAEQSQEWGERLSQEVEAILAGQE